MTAVHPIVRLLTALCLLLATFVSSSLQPVMAVYAIVLMTVFATGEATTHIRFLVLVGDVLLLALLLVWGLAMPQAADGGMSNLQRAWFTWVRLMACAGVVQALFLPLTREPTRLRTFLFSTRMNGSIGLLFVTSVLFLPEVRRRLGQIVDARKAQGFRMSGIAGVLQLSQVLMPLVSSLLDSAVKRAELWSHRAVLSRYQSQDEKVQHDIGASLLAAALGMTAVVIALHT